MLSYKLTFSFSVQKIQSMDWINNIELARGGDYNRFVIDADRKA